MEELRVERGTVSAAEEAKKEVLRNCGAVFKTVVGGQSVVKPV